jgi:ATP-dependent Lhr-like helicase
VNGLDGELWTTTEARSEALAALDGEHAGVVRVVRGHLELSGVTTVAGLSAITSLPADDLVIALAALERDGFAMQGQYHGAATEWVARRLLARMHSYSRRARRQGFEALTAQDFMRFLFRWQHIAPESQLSGEAGLVEILEQLQGFEAAASAWETELFARRLRHYDPAWLDGLCHTGEVAWLRLTPRVGEVTLAAISPSRATPVTVVLRGDLDWLLAAARPDDLPSPNVDCVTSAVLEVLERRGASFAQDLCSAVQRTPLEVEQALWDGVARGLIMCDGFAAVRARMQGHGRSSAWGGSPGWGRLRRGAGAASGAAGRWSLVPRSMAASTLDRHDLAEAVAEQLLARWGVLFRDLAIHDGLRLPWREVQWALRRLEDRGLVRGGRFVSGFSGEQYALPHAVEQLTRVRRLARTHERVTVNATDPLNLVGVIVPGERVAALRTRQVVYVDGVPVAREGGR